MPITVGSVTGLATAPGRYSTRFVFMTLGILASIISETVARRSLAPGQLRSHLPSRGVVTNLIPFRSLNSFLISQILLVFTHWWIIFFFISWLDALNMLNFWYGMGGVGKIASSSANWMYTEMMFVLLCSLTKVKEHTRRKMLDWWQDQEARREALQRFFGTGQGCNPLPAGTVGQPSSEEAVSCGDNQPRIGGEQLAALDAMEQQQDLQPLSAKHLQLEERFKSDHDQAEEVTDTTPNL